MSRSTRTAIAYEWVQKRDAPEIPRPKPSWFFAEAQRRYADPTTFMAAIRVQMDAFGLSQGQLAERVGCDPPRLSRWLRMKVRPTLETMLVLDEAMDRLTRGE